MKIFFYILVGLVFFLIFISFITLKIKVSLVKNDNEEDSKVSLNTLFGLLKYEIIIPYKDIIYNLENELTDKTICVTEELEEKKESTVLNDLKKKYFKFTKYSKIVYKPIKKLTTKKLKIKEFEWITYIGCNDAAATAVLSGVLWMVKGHVIAFLKNIFVCDETDINIVPRFNNQGFKTYLNCIIHIKIGYIITTLIKIAYLLLTKGGELSDESSN